MTPGFSAPGLLTKHKSASRSLSHGQPLGAALGLFCTVRLRERGSLASSRVMCFGGSWINLVRYSSAKKTCAHDTPMTFGRATARTDCPCPTDVNLCLALARTLVYDPFLRMNFPSCPFR